MLLEEEESVTHRFDCNTVGPVPVASGYGSRTLTHSAAYDAPALSSEHEKIHTQNDDYSLRELSKLKSGTQKGSQR